MEGSILVDIYGEYLELLRRVVKEMDVFFVDLNKLMYDLVVSMGVEKLKSFFMWVFMGIYDFCLKGKIDNIYLNIFGGKVVVGIVMEVVVKVVLELVVYMCFYDLEVYVVDYKDDK